VGTERLRRRLASVCLEYLEGRKLLSRFGVDGALPNPAHDPAHVHRGSAQPIDASSRDGAGTETSSSPPAIFAAGVLEGNRTHEMRVEHDPPDEWVRIEGHIATVGITRLAVEELGDVIAIELPTVGTKLVAHDLLGSVESVKAVRDLYSPVAGEVVAVNHHITENPELLAVDPEVWLVRIRVDEPSAHPIA
jgi:glycine cleavage system H protein